MSDIVERLRDRRYTGQEVMRLQAADEIERLRAALEDIENYPEECDSDAAFAERTLTICRRALEGK